VVTNPMEVSGGVIWVGEGFVSSTIGMTSAIQRPSAVT
jgi:hypothetical protein